MTAAEGDRPLYEYRGNRPDPALHTPRHDPIQSPQRVEEESILCASCMSPAQRIAGGWWCESCESAAR